MAMYEDNDQLERQLKYKKNLRRQRNDATQKEANPN
jgi:hypothetical protein